MERLIPFIRKAIILLTMLLAISCDQHKKWEEQNLQIIRDILKERCVWVSKYWSRPKDRYLILKQYPNEDFIQILENGTLEKVFKERFPKEKPLSTILQRNLSSQEIDRTIEIGKVSEIIFSEENVKNYIHQLEIKKKYLILMDIDTNDCIKKSFPKEKYKNEVLPPLFEARHYFTQSGIVFSKNNEYALFLNINDYGLTLNVYKNEEGVFVPYAVTNILYTIY